MANEIRVSTQIQIGNGYFVVPLTGSMQQLTQNVAGGGIPGMVNLTTADTTIDMSSLTKAGYVFIKNIDDTSEIAYGPNADFGMLKPGEEALFRILPTATFKMKCVDDGSSGTVDEAKAIVQIFED